MATLIQLSESLIVNIDSATVLRCEHGRWRLWFADHAKDCELSDAETEVLVLYLHNHVRGQDYHAWRRSQP